jgi:organic hydroperoxide reductase OsmC/OhrA
MNRAPKQHTYEIQTTWTGNDGEGTATYRSYRRDHTIEAQGKPQILGSSDAVFRGDPTRYNPEDLLVAALSACHMLAYLHLCAVNHITVVAYQDAASGVMEERPDGSGAFVHAQLRPTVTISNGDRAKALALHEEAHHLCFIANSVNFPVDVTGEVLEASTVQN